jgi:hypothetical protein
MDYAEPITHIANSILKRYFQKKFPYEPDLSVSVNDILIILPDLKRWKYISAVLLIVVMLGFPLLAGCVFYYLYLLIYSYMVTAPASFLPADWLLFAVPGMFLLLTAIRPIAESLHGFLLQKKLAAYMEYTNRKDGFDNMKASGFIGKIFILPFIITLVMACSSYLIVYPAKFEYREFLDLKPHSYSYTQIKNITYFRDFIAMNGDLRHYPHYRIVFKDNTTFATGFSFRDNNSESKFLSLLTSKGTTTDTVELDPYR